MASELDTILHGLGSVLVGGEIQRSPVLSYTNFTVIRTSVVPKPSHAGKGGHSYDGIHHGRALTRRRAAFHSLLGPLNLVVNCEVLELGEDFLCSFEFDFLVLEKEHEGLISGD